MTDYKKSAQTAGIYYEAYMTRAFKKHYDGVDGKLHESAIRNLIWSENGDGAVKHLGSTDKLFKKVKADLVKGADKFLKFKLTDDERQVIENGRMKLESANSSSELVSIIKEVVSATDRFKF